MKFRNLFTVLLIIIFVIPGVQFAQDLSTADENGNNSGHFEFEEYDLKTVPGSILKLDGLYSPYVIVVEKSKQKLYVFNYDGSYNRVKTYDCTTGKVRGDKTENMDMKTPEGVYAFTHSWDADDLARIYTPPEVVQFGIGAFDMNYPNEYDIINGKSGYDIWLHATDDPERISKQFNTKGCVAVTNTDLKELDEFIELKDTPIIIVKDISYSPVEELEAESELLEIFIEKWKNDWASRNFEKYKSHYSEIFRSNNKNLHQWISSKQRNLENYRRLEITISNFRILKSGKYFIAEFYQVFESDIFRDTGIKKLFIISENGEYKIVNENWKEFEKKSDF
ncbi:murein L,D-transpeptidase family protein [candidate division KSB1 bacterium]